MGQQRTTKGFKACTKNPPINYIFWDILPLWTVRTSWTSSWNSILTWRTTLLFFWPISAARKGHLEARAWPEGGTGWPGGSLDSPACLWPTFKQKRFWLKWKVKCNFNVRFLSLPHLPSLADILSSVFGWKGDEEDEEQRARTIIGGMGLEASSIITGHCWANPSREFLVCWRKVWGMRARNGQRRRRTSISFEVVILQEMVNS